MLLDGRHICNFRVALTGHIDPSLPEARRCDWTHRPVLLLNYLGKRGLARLEPSWSAPLFFWRFPGISKIVCIFCIAVAIFDRNSSAYWHLRRAFGGTDATVFNDVFTLPPPFAGTSFDQVDFNTATLAVRRAKGGRSERAPDRG